MAEIKEISLCSTTEVCDNINTRKKKSLENATEMEKLVL
jgi:hypothetical protein